MKKISIKLSLNPKLYLRDPQETVLGKKIIKHSILLIHELGLEQFNFKRLAHQMDSTEASIYRYFENKHLLFIYLLNWYWEWVKFRIDFHTMNIIDVSEQLKITLRVLVDSTNRNTDTEYVDEDLLHEIVVSEGTKGYHSISVDEENKDGFFLSYKTLCKKIGDMIKGINPTFPYPRALASMLVETANNNLYFAQHLPRLTDIRGDGPNLMDNVTELLEFIAFNLCKYDRKSSNDHFKLGTQLNGTSNGNGEYTTLSNGSNN
jgi:AcrR family transcriptional regulator